jgi:1,4-dihydroxy-2-naphthoyl-CoA hydrolase
MTIWQPNITLNAMNERGRNSLSDHIGIIFTELGKDFLKATMPVNDHTRQPIGILHGGANVVLAETLASTAANAVVNLKTHYCVGLEINANHLRATKEGLVTGTAQPIHLGKSTQIWQILIENEKQQMTCISRMTAAVLKR